MSWSKSYKGLDFERHSPAISRRLITVGVVLIAYLLAWRLMSSAVLFWFGTLAIAVLAWMASYGWREAITILIRWLQRLERL